MKVFTVTNRKGGVGKSTIAAHVAGGLALRGLRVGLIDTDSQAHAGLMLGVRDGNGLHQALVEHKPLNHVVLDVPKYENLWLISSGLKRGSRWRTGSGGLWRTGGRLNGRRN